MSQFQAEVRHEKHSRTLKLKELTASPDEPEGRGEEDGDHGEDDDDDDGENARLDAEIAALERQIEETRLKRLAVRQRRDAQAVKLFRSRLMKDALMERINTLSCEKQSLQEHATALENECIKVAVKLKKLMQVNPVNDAFYIWYLGPFGTINNFRLGKLPVKPIEWTEINAALGQAVLAVSVVASRANYQFTKYLLAPMGSFPKLYKVDDRRSPLSLYTDGSFSLFPKRNFNLALTGFLACVHELGDFTRSRDPTLALPYAINVAEGKVNDQVVLLGDDEVWTRALKFLLTDIKWLIAWSAKHCNSSATQFNKTAGSGGGASGGAGGGSGTLGSVDGFGGVSGRK